MNYSKTIFIIDIGMYDPILMCVICGETDFDGLLKHKEGCNEIMEMALALSDKGSEGEPSLQV